MAQKKRKDSHNLFHYIVTIGVVLVRSIISEAIWIAVGVVGYFIFMYHKTPYDIVIGLPLLLVSIGAIINTIGNQVLSVFSKTYNKGVCVICNDAT